MIKKMDRRGVLPYAPTTLVGLFVFSVMMSVCAAGFATEAAEVQKVQKTMRGNVAFISKKNISIEYSSNEKESYESYMRLSKNLRLQGYKHLLEIQRGDQVEVTYFQETQKGEKEKDEDVLLNTEVEKIKLLRSGNSTGKSMSSREAQK